MPMILKNYMFNAHLRRFFTIASRFLKNFLGICFIENRLKVRKILDFSTFVDIFVFKYTYVLSTFTSIIIIIYQAFKYKNILEHILANMFQKYF
jgi:hypothetical protein